MNRTYPSLKVEQDAHIATFTMNRPERKNALSPALINELCYAFDDAKASSDVHVVILTGANRTFCAGGDLAQMSEAGAQDPLPHRGDFADLLLRMTELGKPIVARVQGVAMGGGLGLVAASTFAMGAESAVLGTPEIKRGLFPMQIMAVLERVVPRRQLLQMMLLGEKMSAKEGEKLGLLTRVVSDDALDQETHDLATKLAAQSPTAMRMGLSAYERQHNRPLRESLPQ